MGKHGVKARTPAGFADSIDKLAVESAKSFSKLEGLDSCYTANAGALFLTTETDIRVRPHGGIVPEREGIEIVAKELRPHWPEIIANLEANNRRFISLMSQDHDLLGRVLKCHLVVEHYMTAYLANHYDVSHIADVKLSFYQKAMLLPDGAAPAAFVKPGILRLNSIRNQFGHTLQPVLRNEDLGAINDVLAIAMTDTLQPEPIDRVQSFTTVCAAFLGVTPPHIQRYFTDAFAKVKDREV